MKHEFVYENNSKRKIKKKENGIRKIIKKIRIKLKIFMHM